MFSVTIYNEIRRWNSYGAHTMDSCETLSKIITKEHNDFTAALQSLSLIYLVLTDFKKYCSIKSLLY